MAQFDGLKVMAALSAQFGTGGARLRANGWAPLADDAPPQWQTEELAAGNRAQSLKRPLDMGARVDRVVLSVSQALVGLRVPLRAPADDWFERVHGFPLRIAAGIILSQQNHTLDLFNAYRKERRTLSAFVNNAGAGIVVVGLPTLPAVVEELDGPILTVQILVDGDPTIDGTLDFIFDDRTVKIPITGQRAILFAVEPESPLVETLRFKTDVLVKRNGKEQRRSLRASPRQLLDLLYETEAFDRQFLEARVFGGHSRAFGIPLWFEPALLTAAITIGASTITVDSTAFADFRNGSLAIVFAGSDNFEALIIQSFTATTLTFESPFTKAFPVGTRVMPVRSVRFDETIRGERWPLNLQRTRLRVVVIDEGKDLSSTAAFPTFNGKVILSEGNVIAGNLEEAYERRMETVDSESGRLERFSNEPVSRRSQVKTFHCRTRQRLWEIRQLIHALRGRTISFYIPTFFGDLTPVGAGISSGGVTLNFVNHGFTKFVNAQAPRNSVRVVLTSGATIVRLIQSAAEIDSATEQITVTAAWGVDAAVSAIERVEIVEKARFDTDDVQIRHLNARGDAVVAVPVKSVLE